MTNVIISLQKVMISSQFRVFVDRLADPARATVRKYLKDNKHSSLHLSLKICTDICPWTLSVPRSSQFSSSFALGKLFASRNR